MRHRYQNSRGISPRDWKRMAVLAISLSVLPLISACQDGTVSASSDQPAAEQEQSWVPGFLASEETVTVPAGERIYVRLDHGISTEQNRSGDAFTARLDQPLRVEDRILAPEGSEVRGRLTLVKDSGRVKGRAAMRLKIEEVVLEGESYPLESKPLAFEAEGTKKDDAAKIGAGAAIGAVVGAIAGGGDGAAKGAAIGGGAGTGLVVATKGKAVEFGPETRFTFVLAEAVDLPAAR